MGTYFRFQINSKRPSSEIAKLLTDACQFLHDADETFSLYKYHSELSQIARSELLLVNASEAVNRIHEECQNWKTKTAGWFDAVNPNGIFDPTGIVKTWAAKQSCIFLEANGINDFTLNAGGDVYLSSKLSIESLHKVGLANLSMRSSKSAGSSMVVDLRGTDYKAAATSGTIEKGNHIWTNKQTDLESDVLQVTVIGKEFVEVDVWATALFSGGLGALDDFSKANLESQFPNIAVLTFADGALLATKGFAQLLTAR